MSQSYKNTLTTQNKKSRFFKGKVLTSLKIEQILESFIEFYKKNHTKDQIKYFYRGWVILCPFHDDHEPSLAIYKNGTTWCFSSKKAYKLKSVLAAYNFIDQEETELKDKELTPDLSKLQNEDWIIINHAQYFYTDGERHFIRVRVDLENTKTKARRKEFYFYQPIINKNGEQVLELVRGYVPLILYRLHEIEDKDWVFFVEGEKCVDALFEIGLCATTLPVGSTIKPSKELYQALIPLKGKRVFIFPDNDQAGWSYAETIKQVLLSLEIESQIIPVKKLWDKSDIADYIEVELAKGRGKEEIRAEIENWTKPKHRGVSFWEAMQKEKEKGLDEFIVPGLFPAKGLGLLIGRSKVGKTELLCLIVSKLLKGKFLFGRTSEKVKVLWVTQEDTKFSIGARLLMRGITPEELNENLFTVVLEDEAVISKENLIKEAKQVGCQVVIVEPLLAIKELAELGIKDKLTYGAIYSVLLPLKKAAEKAGLFVLGVHHANKGKSVFKDWTDVIDGALGSTAFSAVPDCILGIGLTPNGDPNLRRVIAKGRGIELDYLVEWVLEQKEEGVFGKYVEKEEYSFEFDLTPEQRRLIEAIKELGEEATPKQLASRLDKKEGAVKMMLSELLDKGIIGKSKRGCYFVFDKKQKNLTNLTLLTNLTFLTKLTFLTNESQEKSDWRSDFQLLENSGLEGKVRKVSKVRSISNEPSEEVVFLLMPENEKCPVCNCEVWKVKKSVHVMGKGTGNCAKCNHMSWFGNFKKGQILSEADVEYFLADMTT
jgi:5S rRNA maturation endonuclease (ribonuclease M5)/predicted transcriptional regulator